MTTSAPTPAPSSRDSRYQLIQTVLFTAGALLMPAGLVAVGLGWYGAATTKYAYDQFPYLLSGGMLGVCLTTLGGFLYFGAWQAKVANDQRNAARQMADAMVALGELVARQSADGVAPGADGAQPVVAGENGAAVHRRDCTLIAHRDDLRPVTSADTGLSVCRVCSPETA